MTPLHSSPYIYMLCANFQLVERWCNHGSIMEQVLVRQNNSVPPPVTYSGLPAMSPRTSDPQQAKTAALLLGSPACWCDICGPSNGLCWVLSLMQAVQQAQAQQGVLVVRRRPLWCMTSSWPRTATSLYMRRIWHGSVSPLTVRAGKRLC
jgi:hypothetical protein